MKSHACGGCFQLDHGSDLFEGTEMRITGKLKVNLAAALLAVSDHEPQSLTLEELVQSYDAHECGGETLRLRKWIDALGR